MDNRELYFHTYVNTLIYMNGTALLDAIHTYLYDIHIEDNYKTIPAIRTAYNTAVNVQYANYNNYNNVTINNINVNNNINNANQNFDIVLTNALNYTHNFINHQNAN
jgi:hypothetical protein